MATLETQGRSTFYIICDQEPEGPNTCGRKCVFDVPEIDDTIRQLPMHCIAWQWRLKTWVVCVLDAPLQGNFIIRFDFLYLWLILVWAQGAMIIILLWYLRTSTWTISSIEFMSFQGLLYSCCKKKPTGCLDLDNSFFLMATRMDVLPIEF